LLEVGASVRLFGGLEPLLHVIREDLQCQGHSVMRGVAPTPMAAWLLARAGHDAPVCAVQHLAAALADVPVQCLELPQRMVDDLLAMGVNTFGRCVRLPRDALTRRFGPTLLNVMDRALGLCADPRPRWTAAPRFERRMDLAFESADRNVLMRGVELLLSELVGFLHTHDCTASAVELLFNHRNTPATRIQLELVVPSRDPQHIKTLLAQRVEHVFIEQQVLYLGMRVERLSALVPQSDDLYAHMESRHTSVSSAERTDLSEQRGQLLVERLAARLGRERVCVLSVVADHRPERMGIELPWQVHPRARHAHARSDQHHVVADDSAIDMPLWLLPQPRLLAEGGCVDGRLVIEQGPCRIESGWWDGHDIARDYYLARSDHGSYYWLFRECRTPRQWYVHGLFA
jgi:protein ImuB